MEVQYNPETGSGEVITRGGQQPAEPSLQENADLRQSIAFRNTAEHLTERALQKQNNDITQVGGGNVDAEIKLQTTQKELADMQSGRVPFNALRQLQLESQCNTLAQYLVSGQAPPTEDGVAPTPPVEDDADDDRSEELADLRDTLRNDDTLTAALDWGSETLDENVLNALQLGLNSDNPNKLKYASDQISELYRNRESVTTVDSHEDVGALTDEHLQYFESEFDAETARNVALLNHGLRSGKLTMGKATQQALQLGILPAMLKAAKDLPDFYIANF